MNMSLGKHSVTALVCVVLCGCAGQVQMEQTAYGPVPILPPICSGNNTAAGAVVGALLGAAIGAAAGGGRGAELGAALGAGAGGIAGAQTDAQCHQIATQRAMALALVQQQAYLAQQAAANQYGPVPVYAAAPVEYVSSDHHRHRVRLTQLNSYADPATRVVCTGGTSTDEDIDGKTTAAAAAPRMCKGPDGKWAPA